MKDKKKSLLLISMPFAETSIPSIQLALFESYLKQYNITVSTRHLYLKSADSYGLNNYNYLINNPNDSYTAQMVFSKYVFPDHWQKNRKKFRYYYENILAYHQDFLKNLCFDAYVKQTDAFLEWTLNKVDWKAYDIIGFTLNYGQILPSLALAKKIKMNHPEKHIIFGGSTVINELGKIMLSIFDYIDFIVSGEGEESLFLLTTDFDNYQNIPGLIYRKKRKIIWNKNNDYIEMNTLPYPTFQSYFNELSHVSDEISQYFQLYGRIPIELSRGCWWKKCTFCNVGAYHKKYREKTHTRFIEELQYLSDTYKMLTFQVIGSTLSQHRVKELCKKIIRLKRDFTLIIEARAGSLQSKDYTFLKQAGFTHIQTGIEAFSSHYLKKMNKGTRVIDNIAALKFCKENQIKNSYNLIINYPNEEKIDFEETKETIQLIKTYLEPPNISKYIVGYQSPIFRKSDQYNIDQLTPKIIDTIMYPKEILEKNFFFFTSFRRKKYDIENPWDDLVSQWKKNYKEQKIQVAKRNTLLNKLVFYFKDGIHFLKIYDKRYSNQAMIYNLNEIERKLFLACIDIKSFSTLKDEFNHIQSSEIKKILQSFVEERLMYREDDHYLSLPISYQKYYNKKTNDSIEDIKQIQAHIETL